MSIMPPDPDSKPDAPNSLVGVAQLMLESADPFTVEVGHLIDHIGFIHEPPVTCDECTEDDRRAINTPCLKLDCATSIVIAWLRKVVAERG